MGDTLHIKKDKVILDGFAEMKHLFVLHFLPPDRFSLMGRKVSEEDVVFSIHHREVESSVLATFLREISPSDTIECLSIKDFYLPLDTRPVKKDMFMKKLRT